jgi:hypothetical protein
MMRYFGVGALLLLCVGFSAPSTLAPTVEVWPPDFAVQGSNVEARSLRAEYRNPNRELSKEDNESYRWIDAVPDPQQKGNCGNCHPQIYQEWVKEKHAHSIDNPHFLNIYAGKTRKGLDKAGWSLMDDMPDGAAVCNACHAPGINFDDAGYLDLRKVRSPLHQGVHCDYCHKIARVDNAEFGLTHGRFGLSLLRPSKGQQFFGPLDDAARREDVYSPIYRKSEYCASCHEGTVFGIPVYTTYSEWLASPARRQGKQCQDCHMAPTGSMDNIAPGHGGINRDPSTLGNHLFFDGSKESMLRSAIQLNIDFDPDPERCRIHLTLKTSNAGHCLPTGFVDRQLLLTIEGFSAAGKRLSPLPGERVLPRKTGKLFAAQPGLVFAKQLSDFDGKSPVPFWRARPELVDSRLKPDSSQTWDWSFPGGLQKVRAVLIYRPFWQETALAKGWPDNDIKVIDRIFSRAKSGRKGP